jgi:hypothetical protein
VRRLAVGFIYMLGGAAIAVGLLKQLADHGVSLAGFQWDYVFLLYVAALAGTLVSPARGELANFLTVATLTVGVGGLAIGIADRVLWHHGIQPPLLQNPGPIGLGAAAVLITAVDVFVRWRRRR